MSFVTQGRKEITCRDNVGGIKNVYLFPFIAYDSDTFLGSRGSEIQGFPATEVFKYEVRNGNFNEQIINDEEGIYYDQRLTFDLFKWDLTTQEELKKLSNIEIRYIVQYNAGYYKIGGLEKGAYVDSKDITTGGAKSDFNGFSVSINSKEEWKAPFIDIELFTVNGQTYSFIFEDGDNYIFEDSNNFILNT